MKTASYFTKLGDTKLRCDLCPHHCVMTSGQSGICLTRQNIDGELISLNYCRPIASNIDPIEKKPLFHFYPGTQIYSSGPNGCTFKCLFCQNSEISQEVLPVREVSIKDFTQEIINSKTLGVAYTYTEPYIWFETIMEAGAIVKEHGLKNVMVTNGFMEPKPLADLLKVVDAMNIDIKSIRPEFYRKLCKASLGPVLRTCETVRKHCHLEITNLIITGENDTTEEISELVDYVAENLGRDTPLHFSRYFPRYRMNNPPTPKNTLLQAWQIAKEKLDHVYIGNVDAGDKENTYCASCKKLLIRRLGYLVEIAGGLTPKPGQTRASCPHCNVETNIVMG